MTKTYAVTVSFLDPVEGVAFVGATDPEDAKAKALQLFKHRKLVEVVDVTEANDQVTDAELMLASLRSPEKPEDIN